MSEQTPRLHLPVINTTPVIEEKPKHHSYSEVAIWMECGWRHKLQYLEKTDLEPKNIHLVFGTAVHGIMEIYFNEKRLPSSEEVVEMFDVLMKKEEVVLGEKDGTMKEWQDKLVDIAATVSQWFEEEFKPYTFVSCEELIYEDIDGTDRKFKGYIDLIIKVLDKNGDEKYLIIDFKTANVSWPKTKRQDKKKLFQLYLYKKYWGEKNNIPVDDIIGCYILVKKNTKQGEIAFEKFFVDITPEMLEEAQNTIIKMMKYLKKKLYIKNFKSCFFCPYKNTKHCTR